MVAWLIKWGVWFFGLFGMKSRGPIENNVMGLVFGLILMCVFFILLLCLEAVLIKIHNKRLLEQEREKQIKGYESIK